MKIVCIGNAAYDITIPTKNYPIENTKTRVDKKIECGGGPASNAAYLLGKWGMNVSFIGIVGNDRYGKTIKNELESVNVDTKYLELNNDYETTTAFIVSNTSNGSRTVLAYRNPIMKKSDVELDFEPDIILTDSQELDLSLKLINKYSNAISILDAGTLKESNIILGSKVDYLVCSQNFAEELTGIKYESDKEKLYNNLKKQFNTNIIITLESKGCLYEYNGKVKIMPSIEVKAIDSTGAGDIFHGAFTYGIANKMDLEDILKLSNITAGLSVTKIGGRNSVASLEDVMKKYDEFK